jgi:hypothetical protein
VRVEEASHSFRSFHSDAFRRSRLSRCFHRASSDDGGGKRRGTQLIHLLLQLDALVKLACGRCGADLLMEDLFACEGLLEKLTAMPVTRGLRLLQLLLQGHRWRCRCARYGASCRERWHWRQSPRRWRQSSRPQWRRRSHRRRRQPVGGCSIGISGRCREVEWRWSRRVGGWSR